MPPVLANEYLSFGCSITIGTMAPTRVHDIEFSGFTLNTVDSTTLESTWREFLVTLPDPGDVTFTIRFDPADPTHTALFDATSAMQPQDCILTLKGGKQLTFTAYISKFAINGIEPDGILSAQVTLKISGPVAMGAVAP